MEGRQNFSELQHQIKEVPSPLSGEVFSRSTAMQSLDWRQCNHLHQLSSFRNRYVALRHGKSEANADGIHSGDASIANSRYPLLSIGEKQIRTQINAAITSGILSKDITILCSDFLRVKQSATIAASLLSVSTLHIEPRLGERGAGVLEGTSSIRGNRVSLLKSIAQNDLTDPFHTNLSLESPASVMNRSTSVIKELEELFEDQLILLVSHHDTIQILRAACAKIPPGEYHSFPRLTNAGLVELSITNTTYS